MAHAGNGWDNGDLFDIHFWLSMPELPSWQPTKRLLRIAKLFVHEVPSNIVWLQPTPSRCRLYSGLGWERCEDGATLEGTLVLRPELRPLANPWNDVWTCSSFSPVGKHPADVFIIGRHAHHMGGISARRLEGEPYIQRLLDLISASLQRWQIHWVVQQQRNDHLQTA